MRVGKKKRADSADLTPRLIFGYANFPVLLTSRAIVIAPVAADCRLSNNSLTYLV